MAAPADLRTTPYSVFYPDGLEMWRDIFGCALPIHCGDPAGEYQALRNACALMEYSMLYRWHVEGPGALDAVNSVVTRDLTKLSDGAIAYGAVVDDDGMMLDDITMFRVSDQHILVIGGNHDALDALLRDVAPDGTTVEQRRDTTAQLSIQGPKSREILQSITSADLSNEALPYYHFLPAVEIGGVTGQLNRMGFTAELGYEFICDADDTEAFGTAVLDAGAGHGIRFAGMSTMMTARLEGGLIIADLEYDHTSTPFECRLGWTVDFDKADFRGKDALLAAKDNASDRVVTVVVDGHDNVLLAPVSIDGEEVGTVTRAVASPTFGRTVGLARVRRSASTIGTQLAGEVDGVAFTAEVVATPMYDPERARVRS